MENKLSTTCCISGAGPAGIMLGYLLARADIDVIVLEKWDNFLRDFRGDTIHPSTMQILSELNLLDAFLQLPHNETYQLAGEIGNERVVLADFSHLKVKCPFIAFIPQWDFLNFMVQQTKQWPHFHLLMNTEAADLIENNGKIVGIKARHQGKCFEIKSKLVVAADGRHSILREKSGLELHHLSVPMDVLWFRLSRKTADPSFSLGKVDLGQMLIMLERGDYWQCGYLIRKGDFEQIKMAGIENFRQTIAELSPSLADRVSELKDWEQIKLLEVRVDRLTKWYRDGFICIGDAAHAMSPIGGVGINLAIQDAVASSNILIPVLLKREVTLEDLAKIQKRRELPTRITQSIQVFIQNRVIDRVLGNRVHFKAPLIFKLLSSIPYLQRIPAYLVGMGFRPEHVNSTHT